MRAEEKKSQTVLDEPVPRQLAPTTAADKRLEMLKKLDSPRFYGEWCVVGTHPSASAARASKIIWVKVLNGNADYARRCTLLVQGTDVLAKMEAPITNA